MILIGKFLINEANIIYIQDDREATGQYVSKMLKLYFNTMDSEGITSLWFGGQEADALWTYLTRNAVDVAYLRENGK